MILEKAYAKFITKLDNCKFECDYDSISKGRFSKALFHLCNIQKSYFAHITYTEDFIDDYNNKCITFDTAFENLK